MSTLPVYLDNHATTKPDPEVVEAMLPYLREQYGNAASIQHEFGWVAEAAVGVARERVARLIGATAGEIIFTSGATESINLALKGVAEANVSRGRRIVTVATEHKAVLDTCRALGRSGFEIIILPVDSYGLVSVADIERALNPETLLVSVMMANNEIGTIAPVAEIGKLCRSRGVIFHTDATQAAGKIPIDVRSMNIDLLSLSAHKMHGPKGAGALYVRKAGVALTPQIDGGGHERGLRSGTLNVPAIVGFGKSAELARERLPHDVEGMRMLRDRLVEGIRSRMDGVELNGHPTLRLPNNANLSFDGLKADRIMMEMKDVAVSTGSACSTASPEPSHVLRAIGLSREKVLASIRFGLSRWTTEEEVRYAVRRVVESVEKLRARSLSGVAV